MIAIDAVSARVVQIVIENTIRGSVILVAAWGATVFMSRASSAARHMIWTLSIAAILTLPALAALMPKWSVAVQPASTLSAIARFSGGPQEMNRSRPAKDQMPADSGIDDRGGFSASPRRERNNPPNSNRMTAHPPENSKPLATWGFTHSLYFWEFCIWLSGASCVAIFGISGLVVVWRIGRNARPVEEGPLPLMLDTIRRQLQIRRKVRLLISKSATMPVAWGIFRPTILLADEATEWSPQYAGSVLTHELAHVRRWDCAIQFLALFAASVYWFNPLVWLAERRLRVERERACDDIVIGKGASATADAECLLLLARKFSTRIPLNTGLAMARRSGLANRVKAILNTNINRGEIDRRAKLIAVIAVVAVLLPLSAIRLVRNSLAAAVLANPTSKPGPTSPSDRAAAPSTGRSKYPARPTQKNLPAILAPWEAPMTRPAIVSSGFGLTVDNGFDCGTPFVATFISPTHVSVTLETFQLDWWMFRLKGVAGKTVTIDLNLLPDSGLRTKWWKTLTPLYTGAPDLNDPATFAAGPLQVDAPLGPQGLPIPDTKEQTWHYIKDSSRVDNLHFTMTQSFTDDSVYIAEHVPYPPGFNSKFIDGLLGNSRARVIDLGKSPQGRPIRVVRIGAAESPSQTAKPCVLIAAGEQPYQPDGMWACRGCIEFLLGDSELARALRNQCEFLIIPMLDPDGTADSGFSFMRSFTVEWQTPTSVAYANWLQSRVLAGGRIDLVLELHSLQSGECQHLQLWELTQRSFERSALIHTFDDVIRRQFAAADLAVSQPYYPLGIGDDPRRFSGWVAKHYGALNIIYEVNSQAPVRHLTLSQLKDTGRLIASSAGELFASADGPRLLTMVDNARIAHENVSKGNPATEPSQNAIESEKANDDKQYLRNVAHSNPNAATRPVDLGIVRLEGHILIQPPSPPAPVDMPVCSKAATRMDRFAKILLSYAREHDGRFPQDFGSLLAGSGDPHEIAEDCLTPGDERSLVIPDNPTADWVNQNTSYIFLADDVDLHKILNPKGVSSAKTVGTTVMFHTRLDQPFHDPYLDDVAILIYIDGHSEFVPIGEAKRVIEKSQETLKAAR